MGFTFSWFHVACKEGFWEEAFGVLQMGREGHVCLSVVLALCRLPAQTYDQTICFRTSHLSRVRQGLSPRTGKSFLQAGIRNGWSLWCSEFLFQYRNKMGDVHIT